MAPLHRHIAWSYTAHCKPNKLVGLHLWGFEQACQHAMHSLSALGAWVAACLAMHHSAVQLTLEEVQTGFICSMLVPTRQSTRPAVGSLEEYLTQGSIFCPGCRSG